MTQQQIEELINKKILEHEIKISVLSGIFGGIIVSGIVYNIYLLNCKLG